MSVVGGLRVRLIHDSLLLWIKEGLEDLGWFDSGRMHRPIQFPGTPVDPREEIQLNTISLADEDLDEWDAEMGSNLVETSWLYYVDFYAENDTIGKELINDVRDILAGRMPHIGKVHPRVPVLDLRQADPPVLFHVEIEGLVVDRARDFPEPWMKHWYTCRFEVNDAYGPSDVSMEDES